MSSPKRSTVPDAEVEAATPTLGGLRVLVTRPPSRGRPLSALLRQKGAIPVLVPAIEIAPSRDPESARQAMARLALYDLAIFVSPSAVEHALEFIPSGWPRALRAAAIGPGTRDALLGHGIEPAFEPKAPFDSEALLACRELAADRMAGSRFALLKGEGGREHLAHELRRRGARVDEIETYRRRCPRDLRSRLRAAPAPDLVVLTSVEAARNLLHAAGESGRGCLAGAHFVAISGRVAHALPGLGVESPASVAPRASDAGLLAAMEEWALKRR